MDLIKELGESALGSRLKRLSDYFMQDVAKIYEKYNLNFEPKWFVLTNYLHKTGESSILDIALALDLSHPAIVQFVNQMESKGLLLTQKDKNDKRKRLVKLSKKGTEFYESLAPFILDIESSVKDLITESNIDFMHSISALENVIKQKDVFTRIDEKIKKRMLDEIRIVTYDSEYKDYFKSLNFEWLEKYFEVEEQDIKLLSNPEKEILDKDGEIFFAIYDKEIVGTCAALKISSEEFELTKMAVTGKHQGKQIGKKLALAVIGFAYSKGAKTIFLETADKLTKAVNLYESLGFKYTHENHNSKYKRTTIRMRLDFF